MGALCGLVKRSCQARVRHCMTASVRLEELTKGSGKSFSLGAETRVFAFLPGWRALHDIFLRGERRHVVCVFLPLRRGGAASLVFVFADASA